MFEWTVNAGNLIILVLTIFGFLANGLVTIFTVSRWIGSIDIRLQFLEKQLEKAENHLADVLIEMARARTEINLLSKRIDEMQQHGSYRLAEILSNVKSQSERAP